MSRDICEVPHQHPFWRLTFKYFQFELLPQASQCTPLSLSLSTLGFQRFHLNEALKLCIRVCFLLFYVHCFFKYGVRPSVRPSVFFNKLKYWSEFWITGTASVRSINRSLSHLIVNFWFCICYSINPRPASSFARPSFCLLTPLAFSTNISPISAVPLQIKVCFAPTNGLVILLCLP